uniref:Uncharacterized protein n=1 Tax=Phlebotomus papatasi TaxID=29031 RepID=A0A1B0D9J0_PHLPP
MYVTYLHYFCGAFSATPSREVRLHDDLPSFELVSSPETFVGYGATIISIYIFSRGISNDCRNFSETQLAICHEFKSTVQVINFLTVI